MITVARTHKDKQTSKIMQNLWYCCLGAVTLPGTPHGYAVPLTRPWHVYSLILFWPSALKFCSIPSRKLYCSHRNWEEQQHTPQHSARIFSIIRWSQHSDALCNVYVCSLLVLIELGHHQSTFFFCLHFWFCRGSLKGRNQGTFIDGSTVVQLEKRILVLIVRPRTFDMFVVWIELKLIISIQT